MNVPRSPRNASANDTVPSQVSAQDVAANIEKLSINGSRPVSGPPTIPNPPATQRPVSTAENQNPREFQLNQLRRRFRPKEQTDGFRTSLEFGMAPSDPDFPFELEKLQCILYVPLTYPEKGRPTLKVTNPEMDSIFQENVERGFDDIVDTSLRNNGRGTLLSWMNTLDRHLERLLSVIERGPTLKFIANAGNKETPGIIEPTRNQELPAQSQTPKYNVPIPVRPPAPSSIRPVYSAEEKAQAEKRRGNETRQLEARLGRLPLFQKSSDGVSFTVPIQPSKPDRLPVPLRSVKTAKLLVPLLYPLEHSSIELQGADRIAARPVEVAFAQWVKENHNLNLMSQVNYLASNMHTFANRPLLEEKVPELTVEQSPEPNVSASEEVPQPTEREPTGELDDRSHIHVIPRPPEWAAPDNGSDDEFIDVSTSDEDFSDEDGEDGEDGGAPVPDIPDNNKVGRGVALSFPFLELYGIELLDLVNLYITIKCERCKEPTDVKNIRQVKDTDGVYSPKIETCKKCTNSMSIGK